MRSRVNRLGPRQGQVDQSGGPRVTSMHEETAVTNAENAPSISCPQDPSSKRLLSVDALRGFDMFWIVGAGGIVKALQSLGGNSVLNVLAAQLKHKEWEGFAFEDLIQCAVAH